MKIHIVFPESEKSKDIPEQNVKPVNKKSLLYSALDFSKKIIWIFKFVFPTYYPDILKESKYVGNKKILKFPRSLSIPHNLISKLEKYYLALYRCCKNIINSMNEENISYLVK
ncbi:MAG: hypothetical protein JJ848_000360 [Prochlorococcus marinus CUG1439]|uniref:hypothetical protein n=1 Tax=Prochlorococcus sp. MIT 1314 TaxID=3096220 RepID=UPI001B0DB59E|nr:hypothetical protein [Prochlorococcus sp. MIT 1314]MCR8538793.1 hypothetical protein [Prochlorococcus marinus CUG1439]